MDNVLSGDAKDDKIQLESNHNEAPSVINYHNSQVIAPPKAEWPTGFIYIEDFFSEEEQRRILDVIDRNGFDQKIHRKQQFYGPVYYHTPQSLRSVLQPVDDTLPTEIWGANSGRELEVAQNAGNHTAMVSDDTPKNIPNSDPTTTSDQDEINAKPSIKPSAANRHSLDDLQWVIDKLRDHGLFEYADPQDPFIEYVEDPNHPQILKIHRRFIPSSTNPLTAEEQDRAHINYENGQWGDNALYPDQILVNEYLVAQNIGTHYDDALAFGPLIVGVSLAADCTLVLSQPCCIGQGDKSLRDAAQDYHAHDGHLEQCSATTKEICQDLLQTNQCTNDDIEDLFQDYIGPNGESLSYTIGLRDFVRPGWREGPGVPLLTKYCRCARERLLAKYHEHGNDLIDLRRHQALYNPFKFTPVGGNPVNEKRRLRRLKKKLEKERHRKLYGTDHPDTRCTAQNNGDDPNITGIDCENDLASLSILEGQSVHSSSLASDVSCLSLDTMSMTTIDTTDNDDGEDQQTQGNLPSTCPRTEQELEAFIMNYDYEELIKNSHEPHINVNDALIPTLPDVNQCKHTSHTLYLPVAAGSVYILAGAARYQYRHAIKKMSRTEAKNNPDYRRVSLTIRSLLPGRRQVAQLSEIDHSLNQYNYNSSQQQQDKVGSLTSIQEEPI